MSAQLLAHFGISEAALLGEGDESRVYMLDAERVLRVPKLGTLEQLRERTEFLKIVATGSYSFAVPQVLGVGEFRGQPYVIERRIYGQTLRELFPTLSTSERRIVLQQFLLAIEELATASVANLPYGDLYGEKRKRARSWTAYLRAKASAKLRLTQSKLQIEVPELGRALRRFWDGVGELDHYGGKVLVHGDYYPAHVLIDQDFKVSGLVHFGQLTLVGDPDIDRAEALSSVEDASRDGASSEEAEYFRALLTERYGESALRRIRTYQLYYAILFSDCKATDPVTYRWCVAMLQRAIDERF